MPRGRQQRALAAVAAARGRNNGPLAMVRLQKQNNLSHFFAAALSLARHSPTAASITGPCSSPAFGGTNACARSAEPPRVSAPTAIVEEGSVNC